MTDAAQRPTLKLPEYVRQCGWCEGAGETVQTYTAGCGGGYYRDTGPCPICTPKGGSYRWKGVGYLYKHSGDPIPDSVVAQIEIMNSK